MNFEKNNQSTLNLKSEKKFFEEDYIISSSNIDAYSSINAEGSIGFSPFENILIIRGEKSSGKTFLSKIFYAKNNAEFINSHEEIIQKMKYFNSFIIDDAEKLNQESLFHAINLSKEYSKNLIIFMNKKFEASLPDLKSRLASIKTSDIKKADDNLIEIFITSCFSKKAINVNKETINFIKNRISREFSDIENFIDSLDKYCLKNKKNLNIKSASSFLRSV